MEPSTSWVFCPAQFLRLSSVEKTGLLLPTQEAVLCLTNRHSWRSLSSIDFAEMISVQLCTEKVLPSKGSSSVPTSCEDQGICHLLGSPVYSDTSTGAGQRAALDIGLAHRDNSGGTPSPRAALLPLVENGNGPVVRCAHYSCTENCCLPGR